MAECDDNVQKPGASNPIQSKILTNDHGAGGASSGDNTITGVTCDASVAVGDVVRMSGSTAVKAIADTLTNSKVIGIAVAKASSTECSVQVTGFTTTIFAGLVTNTDYFLSSSTAGALTTSPPTGSGNTVTFIGRAYTPTQLVININTPLIRD